MYNIQLRLACSYTILFNSFKKNMHSIDIVYACM